jgi:TPR repeat protein
MNAFPGRIVFTLLIGGVFCGSSAYAESIDTKPGTKGFVEDLMQNAEQGDVQAQYRLGRLYDPKLNAYANALYEPGIYYDQNAPITELDKGFGTIETDPVEAEKWYLKAAEQGHAEAQKTIGTFYFAYTDYEKAEKWLRKAAKKEDTESQYYLGKTLCGDCYGHTYEQDPVSYSKINLREAAKWFELAAKNGHADAQYRIAAMLFDGKGIAKNDKEALKWAHSAVAQNVIDAKVLLGHMYYEGRGVKQDYSKAVELYREALRQIGGIGFLDAQILCTDCSIYAYNHLLYTEVATRLGNLYYKGQGVEQDYSKSLEFYFAAGLSDLSSSLLAGFDPEWKEAPEGKEIRIALKRYPIVAQWVYKNAEQGNVRARLSIAKSGYAPYSLEKVSEWIRDGAEQGNAGAQLMLEGNNSYHYCYYANPFSETKCNEAIDLSRKSAERGSIEAQLFLANFYSNKNARAEAAKWYALSAKGGYIISWIELKRLAVVEKIPEAQYTLGQLFAEGCCYGVKKNEQNALKLFQMAAEQGYEPAKQAIENMKGEK